MKITTKIILGLLGGLILSGIVNYIQYRIYHRKPVVDTVVVTTDNTEHDTVWQIVYKDTVIIKPEAVKVDTVLDIRYYMDTVYFERGWVSLQSVTQGSLLSQGVGVQFSVPNYYQTRTITNSITNTVRNDLFYATLGLNYNYMDQGFYPSAGLVYIWNKHRRYISLEYSLDKRIDLNVGFNLWR